jgi:hypothetical protein
LLVFGLNLLLVSPSLMPAFSEINGYDEAKYVESGRYLLAAELRGLSWGPLLALVYAPLHLILGGSPDWFLLEDWAGRFILFGALWLSTAYLGLQVRDYVHPFVVVGVLFVVTPFIHAVENQSDALFASLSALGLAKVMAFHKRHQMGDAWAASAMVGLATLTRAEGVTLVVPFGLAILLAGSRYGAPKLASAILLPFAVLIGIYLLLFRLSSGSFDLGMAEKAYDSFEVNQSVLTGGNLGEGRLESIRLFGSAEQNQGSVVRAILRNPPAFGMRILANLRTVPDSFFFFFGKRQGPMLVFFAFWGVYHMLHRRSWRILAMSAAWVAPSTISLGFLATHLVPQVAFLFIVFAAMGIGHVCSRDRSRGEKSIFLALSALLAGYGWADHKPAVLMGGLIVMVAIALGWIATRPNWGLDTEAAAPALILLCAGLILRGPYSFPDYPSIGGSEEEQAIHYMQREIPEWSQILVHWPLPAIASGMVDVGMGEVPEDIATAEAFVDWLASQDIRAVYHDNYFVPGPDLIRLIEESEGRFLDRGFLSQDGRIRVLVFPGSLDDA